MEHAITAFTATFARAWISDASCANPFLLSVLWHPEERPGVSTVLHLLWSIWRLASVGGAGAIRCSVNAIVLMIGLEDGECLDC